MSTLTQIRDRVNTWLANRWPALISRQETFFGLRGRYWQGLITHVSIPSHTTSSDGDSLGDNFLLHPTDQLEDWLMFWPAIDNLSSWPAALIINVYESLEGHGFAATVLIYHNGTLYRRIQGYGPKAALFTKPWAAVDLLGGV